jgi:hypothetical protein
VEVCFFIDNGYVIKGSGEKEIGDGGCSFDNGLVC